MPRRGAVRNTTLSEGMRHAAAQMGDEMRNKAFSGIITDALSQTDELTRRDILRSVLKKKKSDAKGCVVLPSVMCFFILYTVGMQLHKDITTVYRLESAIRGRIDRNLQEVETIGDVWQWLREDYLGTMFVQEDIYGDALPHAEWNRVLIFNQAQGSVIVSQSRSGSGFLGMQLYGPLDNGTQAFQEANEGFMPVGDNKWNSRRLEVLRDELSGSLPGRFDGDYDSEYEVHIYPGTPLAEIRMKFDYLEQREWIDADTGALTIRALLLNAELGRPILEELTVLITFSRGGDIYYKTSMQAFFLEAFNGTINILVDLIWALMLLGTTVSLGAQLWEAFGAGGVLACLSDIDMSVQWTITIGGWFIVVAFILVHFSYTNAIEMRLGALRRAVAEEGRGGQVGGAGSQQASELLHKAVQDAGGIVEQYNTANTWYTLILMLRFFYSFHAQPRLAVVTKTMRATGVDLLHFLVFFTPVFIAFVISGNLIFGRRLEEFSTIRSSVGACFRIVIENEFDWERLSEEHFVTTLIWVGCFLLGVVLIMLNMVMAIILDIYNEVRHKIDSADTVFLFLKNLGRQVWNGRNWISDSAVDDFLSKIVGSTSLSKDDLLEMIPGLTHAQADMLFKACRSTTDFTFKQNMGRGLLLQLSTSIRMSVDRLNALVRKKNSDQKDPSITPPLSPRRKSRTSLRKSTGSSNGSGRSKGSGSVGARPRSPSMIEQKPVVIAKTSRPTGLEKRLEGQARAFPGMPQIEHTCNVPLLPPAEASNERPDEATRPTWLKEVDQVLDSLEEGTLELQAQLQALHERLFERTMMLANRCRSRDAMALARHENSRVNSKEHGEAAADVVDPSAGASHPNLLTSKRVGFGSSGAVANSKLHQEWFADKPSTSSLEKSSMVQIL